VATAKLFTAVYGLNRGAGFTGFGLSAAAVDKLVGAIGQFSRSEEEFVSDAHSYATNFVGAVQLAIEDLQEDPEPSQSDQNDLDAMKDMLTWTYDEGELEMLARAEWQAQEGI
jgi:hypothetical protein